MSEETNAGTVNEMAETLTVTAETPATEPMNDGRAVEFARDAYANIQRELAKVIVGQQDVIEEILIAIFTRSHALLVGVPGLAKTLMISSLARTLQMSFKRIQFTPDLMPSDITGTEVIYQDQTTGEKQFKFLRGPLFANIVLADEINRTPPKTQAAMLEAMQERRVTVGGKTHALPRPFFVLATQNPLEQEGTYPLPEAQLDRFMFLINVDYPEVEEEIRIMQMGTGGKGEELQPVIGAEGILFIQDTVKLIPVSEHVYRYAQKIAGCTRTRKPEAAEFCKKYLNFGAGPRASLGLIIAAKAHALIHGQPYVSCENVAAVAKAIMRHRISVNFTAQSEGITSDDVVKMILEQVPQNEPLA
ncbi:MAG: MoxR family ATPase [Verrucomicrobiales bacterium]|jgi:MoxR-like ATPase|nr:MoxR family ATPase [Verrucomicrobiales bacterium]